jgi:SPP1 gp7 family putative phage head morphogenesis protein
MSTVDAYIRISVLVERYKTSQALKFGKVKSELEQLVREISSKKRFLQLNELTRKDLLELRKILRKEQEAIYARWQNELLFDLEKFIGIYSDVVKRVDASKPKSSDDGVIALATKEEADEYAKRNEEPTGIMGAGFISDDLWKLISLSAIPASGVVLSDFISKFVSTAKDNLENSIVAASANRQEWKEAIESVIGASVATKAGTSSVLDRIQAQAVSVVHTGIAHAESITEAAVNSTTHRRYLWASIIDGRTSDICMSRHGKVYNFGEGPLPPAHVRCRSRIIPFKGNKIPDIPSLFSWLKKVSSATASAIVGAEVAKKIAEGVATEKVVLQSVHFKPLDLDDFEKAAEDFLTTGD